MALDTEQTGYFLRSLNLNFLTEPADIQIFITIKESVNTIKEFKCHRTGLGFQHDRTTVSLFCHTHMTAVTSCKNILYSTLLAGN